MKISAVWGLLLAPLALLSSSVTPLADPGNRNDHTGDDDIDQGLHGRNSSGSQFEGIAGSVGQLQSAEGKPAHKALNERVRNLRASLEDPAARIDPAAEASSILSDAAAVVDAQADFVRALRDSLERDDAELFVETLDALADQLDDLIEEFSGREEGGGEVSRRRMDLGDAPANVNSIRNQIASLESISHISHYMGGLGVDRTLDDIGLVSNALRDAQAIIQQRNGSRKLLKKNREAKQNLFSDLAWNLNKKKKQNRPNESYGSPNQGDDQPDLPWVLMSSSASHNMDDIVNRVRQSIHHHQLPDLDTHFGGNEEEKSNRRLETQERHGRRMEGLEQCRKKCDASDVTCNCAALSGCVHELSDYDMAALALQGFIVTDEDDQSYGSLSSSSVDLFVAASNFYKDTILPIRKLAGGNDCKALLSRFAASCNPLNPYCNSPNTQMYQNSIDNVCAGVNTNNKLLFSTIGDELDGYAPNDGGISYTTTCGSERVALKSCGDFIDLFGRLYDLRDTSVYPNQNPMFPSSPNSGDVLMPIDYQLKYRSNGVASIDFEERSNRCDVTDCRRRCYFQYPKLKYHDANAAGDRCSRACNIAYCDDLDVDRRFDICLRDCQNDLSCNFGCEIWNTKVRNGNFGPVVPSVMTSLCLQAEPNDVGIHMRECDQESDDQVFFFSGSSHEIKDGSGRCLEGDPVPNSGSKVRMSPCNLELNQKWYYDFEMETIKAFSSNYKCLTIQGDGSIQESPCDDNGSSSQRFSIPFSWDPIMSTSSIFQEIRNDEDITLCMQLVDPYLSYNNPNVAMRECASKYDRQLWHYDVETRAIRSLEYCLDYNHHPDGRGNVYANKVCHGGPNQQFYINENGNIKTFFDDKCLDMYKARDNLYGNIYMYPECHSNANQRFHIPILWLDNAYLDELRGGGSHRYNDGKPELEGISSDLCMTVFMSYQRNVNMTTCLEDSEVAHHQQEFEFDPDSQQIVAVGLCLDYNPNNMNVYLHECTGWNNQKWRIEGENIFNQHDNSCLTMMTINESEMNNLHMAPTCDPLLSKFRIPAKWTRLMPLQDTKTYEVRPIATGIWTGEWNEATSCQIDMLVDVTETCDESQTLLLGNSASLGTLEAVVKLIESEGPSRMPGVCCLDDPSNSEWLGYFFDPHRNASEADPQPMKCVNHGPWHLGISEEACANANGQWFRQPCITLKECLDNRPKNGTVGYSPSFEEWARHLVILDDKDESQCEEARSGLGFTPNYPYDVDVCREFEMMMCDPFYTSLDSLSSGATKHKDIHYDPVPQPQSPDLHFDEIEEMKDWEFEDDAELVEANFRLSVATASMKSVQNILDLSDDLSEKLQKSTCSSIIGSPLAVPFRVACELVIMIAAKIVFAIKLAYQIARDGVAIAEVIEGHKTQNHARNNYEMQIEDREWLFRSTQTLNLNMYEQNTQVLHELQKKHTDMLNKLQSKHTDIQNSLGRMQDAIHDNQRQIIKGTETIETAIEKTCTRKIKRNQGGRLLEKSKAFNDAVVEDSLSESYIGDEEVEEDIVGLAEVNMKLEQLQKDMDDRFGRLEDKFEDRLDRLETLLGKLVEQQQVA